MLAVNSNSEGVVTEVEMGDRGIYEGIVAEGSFVMDLGGMILFQPACHQSRFLIFFVHGSLWQSDEACRSLPRIVSHKCIK